MTGAAGFIGFHAARRELKKGNFVIGIDNLDNSRLVVLEGISNITQKRPLFKNLDLKDKGELANFFKKHDNIHGIIHLLHTNLYTRALRSHWIITIIIL